MTEIVNILNIITVTSVKVLHQIPGRLRLSVPLFKKFSSLNGKFNEEIKLKLIKLLPEVQSATVNFITGTLLIEFDHKKISADRIFKRIQKTIKNVSQHPEIIQAIKDKQYNRILKLISQTIVEESTHAV